MKLWLINSDGSHPQRLSSEEDNDFLPSVSQDDRTIFFTSQPVSALELWKMNIDGTHRTKLAGYAGDPQVSPDGNWVVYTATDEGSFILWKVTIDGGDPVPVIKTPAFGAAISPEGDRIACFLGDNMDTDKLKIAVLPSEGGEPDMVFEIPDNINPSTSLRWIPDGSALTYIIDHGGVSNIWSQPLDGSTPVQLTRFYDKQIFSFDWSHDGTLACARGEIDHDVVLIRNVE
jgi:Tol biopolymer transport system component